MKYKIRLIIGLLFVCIITIYAQKDDNTKKEIGPKDYLPKQGNFGVGTLAAPVFNFFGNMLSSAGTNKLDMSIPSIIAKYYISDMSAIRLGLSTSPTGTGTTKLSDYSRDDAAFLTNPLSNAQVTDSKLTLNNNLNISLGWQNFIGQNRLRGFYGIQLLSAYSSTKDVYNYGNPMTLLNPTPTTSIAGAYSGSERLLENKTASSFTIGAGAIAGFEYYVLPKLCIGGEVSLNILYNMDGQSYSKTEKIEKGQYLTIDKPTNPAYSDYSIKTLSFDPTGNKEQIGFYVMLHF